MSWSGLLGVADSRPSSLRGSRSRKSMVISLSSICLCAAWRMASIHCTASSHSLLCARLPRSRSADRGLKAGLADFFVIRRGTRPDGSGALFPSSSDELSLPLPVRSLWLPLSELLPLRSHHDYSKCQPHTNMVRPA